MQSILSTQSPPKPLPLVFDSPHSGTSYPPDFGYDCDFTLLRGAEDHYIDQLFAAAPAHNATLLCALFPRSYIDVNRRADDVDPLLMDDVALSHSYKPSARSDAGIGLIRRLVRPGTPIYTRHLSEDEIQHRIAEYYMPYHEALGKLIDQAYYNFGQVWHINCHAMPAATAFPKLRPLLAGQAITPADIVLGNRDGTTCDSDFIHMVRDFFVSNGYRVTINDPFKGVELVRRYSAPTRGRHSLQIEINKALYMNEATLEKTSNYSLIKAHLDEFIAHCADYVSSRLNRLAAD